MSRFKLLIVDLANYFVRDRLRVDVVYFNIYIGFSGRKHLGTEYLSPCVVRNQPHRNDCIYAKESNREQQKATEIEREHYIARKSKREQ